MSAVIPGPILRLAADLERAFDTVLAEHLAKDDSQEGWVDIFAPYSIRLYTINGYTAKFWEGGVEFYPEEKAE